jgi:nitrogen fixation/metabolism regulation signal transduction histidine kinase
MKHKRRRFLIDRPVQLGIVGRLTVHWLLFLATVIVTLPLLRAIVLGDFATPMGERVRQAGVDAVILLILFVGLFPYFIYDIFRMTNRFAGPMYRLHQAIKSAGTGTPFQPIKFRSGDLWQYVAVDFNKMVERLQNGRGKSEDAEAAEEEAATV